MDAQIEHFRVVFFLIRNQAGISKFLVGLLKIQFGELLVAFLVVLVDISQIDEFKLGELLQRPIVLIHAHFKKVETLLLVAGHVIFIFMFKLLADNIRLNIGQLHEKLSQKASISE